MKNRYLSNWKKILKDVLKNMKDGETKKNVSQRRFWNLFRSDLMRRDADTIFNYLENRENRIQTDYQELAETITAEFKKRDKKEDKTGLLEALILFCLEKDAAFKLAEFRHTGGKGKFPSLEKKLSVLEN